LQALAAYKALKGAYFVNCTIYGAEVRNIVEY
jgi:hypothetical protein